MKYRINHTKVISQANLLSDQAVELSRQIKELEGIENNCNAAWKGEAAETFRNKLRELRKETESTRKRLLDLASTIKYCADQIQTEDEKQRKNVSAL